MIFCFNLVKNGMIIFLIYPKMRYRAEFLCLIVYLHLLNTQEEKLEPFTDMHILLSRYFFRPKKLLLGIRSL